MEIHQLKEMRKEECERGVEMRTELKKEASELQKHQNKETGLQNELRMLREERSRTDNETLRSHTVQIEQLEAKARLKNEEQERQWNRKHKEQGMRQEKEISQLKETTRLQNEE